MYDASTPSPTLSSALHDLQAVLEADAKYDPKCTIAVLRKVLVSPHLLEMSPLRVYAITCRHDLEEEAKIVARYALNTKLLDAPLSEDLRHVDAYSYHQLLTRHFQAAQGLIKVTARSDACSAMALLSMWMGHQNGGLCLRRQPNRSWRRAQPLLCCL